MSRSNILSFLLFLSVPVFCQEEPIELINPSFEGRPTEGSLNGPMPAGWYDCGFPGESVPDMHPIEGGGTFKVDKAPFNGNTYLGMVVRENDTWEAISQRLGSPVSGGKCYEFSISLCRSELYVSRTRPDNAEKNFTTPAKLRIWGGNSYCNKAELLAESALIVNTRWLEYNFRFEPKQAHGYIIFEIFYKTPTPFPYNGNILMDNCSAIIPVPCEVVAVNAPAKPIPPKPDPPVKPNPNPPKPGDSVTKKPAILPDLVRSKIKKGQTIRIDQLFFQADSSKITSKSYPALGEIYDFMNTNSDVTVEVGGHTNSIPPDDYCDRLSTARAKAVVDYLVDKGIPRTRLQYKGYGKRSPTETNKTETGRKRNQRVEIKILSFNG